MYVDIVISNVFNLNKLFFYLVVVVVALPRPVRPSRPTFKGNKWLRSSEYRSNPQGALRCSSPNGLGHVEGEVGSIWSRGTSTAERRPR